MYAMYSQLNLDYLYPSLHDDGEFVQLVHCCLPRFQSNAQHVEGTQCILLIWMNALTKKSVSVFISILKNLFFNRALTLLGKWGNLWIICLEKGTHTAMSHTTMKNSQMSWEPWIRLHRIWDKICVLCQCFSHWKFRVSAIIFIIDF